MKRTINKATAPSDAIAVPDFVITRKGYSFDGFQDSDDILGCVEVKYKDVDVKNPVPFGRRFFPFAGGFN